MLFRSFRDEKDEGDSLRTFSGSYEELGEGQVSKVTRRRSSEWFGVGGLSQDIAVKKVTLLPIQGNWPQRERLHRETRFAAELSHPNLLHFYEQRRWFSSPNSAPYGESALLVSELLDGGSVGALVKTLWEEGRDEAERIEVLKNVAFQLLMGLNYIHQSGVIHRHINLDNVMLAHPYDEASPHEVRIKIIDLGSASECKNRK
jgi:serine/threonine protein kinase